ncbi:MAG: hypothetical protein U0S48_18630 [Solirubrobacteraceae bacterium]
MADRALFIDPSGSVLWASEDPGVVACAREHGVHLDDDAEARAALLLAESPDLAAGLGLDVAQADPQPDADDLAAERRADAILEALPELLNASTDVLSADADAEARANLMMSNPRIRRFVGGAPR